MKPYLSLCILCYALFLVLPLPLLRGVGTDKLSEPSPSTTVTTTTTTKPTVSSTDDAAVFRVLDAAAKVVYTFTERDFLIYTVAAEMPASYPPEALKAQAVASYTYYTYQKNRKLDNLYGADFADAPSFPDSYTTDALRKRWGDNYDKHLGAIAEAVDAVAGELLLYENKPIFAAYHSNNSGVTESSKTVWDVEYPYLQSVNSSGDALAPNNRTTVTVSDEKFAAAFPKLELKGNADDWITGKPTVSDAGTVTAITVGGKTLTGREVREALELRSACFTVTHGKDGFTFEVAGYGHGVGMSQFGAKTLAEQGFTYREILRHYYTGVTLK